MTPQEPNPVRDALVGQVLRGSSGVGYHVRDLLGEGGQGWVFRANWDDADGLVVVVKVLRPDVIAEDSLKRFQREALVLRMLSQQPNPCPYVVRFYDHYETQLRLPDRIAATGDRVLKLPFTVLEYVRGTTLERVLAASPGRGLPLDRVRRLFRHVVQALDYVHAQKVVHRDLKPSNVLLTMGDGEEIAKVTDFGLVKIVSGNMERTAQVAGASIGYAPPEQYEKGNRRVGPHTDVFSLAAVLYEMLLGVPAYPFRPGENPLIVLTRILNDARPSLRKTKALISPELAGRAAAVEALDREIARALDPDPAKRHPTAAELFQAIDPHLRTALEQPPTARGSFRDAGVFDSDVLSQRIPALSSRAPPSPKTPSVAPPRAPTPEPKSAEAVGTLPLSQRGRGSPAERTAPLDGGAAQRPAAPPPAPVPMPPAHRRAPWRWTALTSPAQPTGTFRAAIFSDTGDRILAMDANGFFRISAGERKPVPIPATMPFAFDLVLGATRFGTSDILVFGRGGLVALVSASLTECEPWLAPDDRINLLGAYVEGDIVTLVGEHAADGKSAGAIVRYHAGRLGAHAVEPRCGPLHAVAPWHDGGMLACGDLGALVRFAAGQAEYVGSACAAHLYAIRAITAPDAEAVAVGSLGHAARIDRRFQTTLERVGTQHDIRVLGSGRDGLIWAGAEAGRILCRTEGAWPRANPELHVSGNVIAFWFDPERPLLRAFCDDGTLLEGSAE
jgi:serine/threonine protein kinase